MIKRVPQNSILVELEKVSDDQYKFASGLSIFLNTTYKPENYQRIYGKCAAVPDILTKGDLIKWDTEDSRHIDSIVPEVEIGDRVYFTYISVNRTNLIEYEGKMYYRINYAQILCVVREAVTIPIGGWILCEEYYGENTESIEVEGRKVYGEVSKSGLITSIIKKPSQKQAIVKIVGKPLKEDNMELESGDLVVFANKIGFKNNIEGVDYVFLRYWDVMAVIDRV